MIDNILFRYFAYNDEFQISNKVILTIYDRSQSRSKEGNLPNGYR